MSANRFEMFAHLIHANYPGLRREEEVAQSYRRIFFFFSSRRRHTRCLSDWSSDVCSSDLSFVTGCAQAFGGPAYQSLVPTLVGKEHLPNAIALNSIQFNLARVIGPIVAGAEIGRASCRERVERTGVAVRVEEICSEKCADQ